MDFKVVKKPKDLIPYVRNGMRMLWEAICEMEDGQAIKVAVPSDDDPARFKTVLHASLNRQCNEAGICINIHLRPGDEDNLYITKREPTPVEEFEKAVGRLQSERLREIRDQRVKFQAIGGGFVL